MDLKNFIREALAEDVGSGDYTSLACISASATGKARLLVKEHGVIAGVAIAKEILSETDHQLQVDYFISDGQNVKPGDEVFHIHGKTQSILKAERLLLNCMQRMSGIATTTRRYADALQGLPARVLDTRKTTPLFRMFEKEAVRIGGGVNHRMGLYDMILIKDNHVDAAGGIRAALDRARLFLEQVNLPLQIEIETRNLDEVKEVLNAGGADRIMMDNFTPEKLAEAVSVIGRRYITEASGGITLETIRSFAETGVDYISVGALTHSVKSLDLSLKIV